MKNLFLILFLINSSFQFIRHHPLEVNILKKKFKLRKTGKSKLFKKDNYTHIYVPLKSKKHKRHLHKRKIPAHSFYGVEPYGIKFGNHVLKIKGPKKELRI